jgi:hypothetical protein
MRSSSTRNSSPDYRNAKRDDGRRLKNTGKKFTLLFGDLHRKEGDSWNARYWHRSAGTTLPRQMSLAEEWASLVGNLLSQ